MLVNGRKKTSSASRETSVAYGHKLGYVVGFYCLDGSTQEENQGWDAEDNF